MVESWNTFSISGLLLVLILANLQLRIPFEQRDCNPITWYQLASFECLPPVRQNTTVKPSLHNLHRFIPKSKVLSVSIWALGFAEFWPTPLPAIQQPYRTPYTMYHNTKVYVLQYRSHSTGFAEDCSSLCAGDIDGTKYQLPKPRRAPRADQISNGFWNTRRFAVISMHSVCSITKRFPLAPIAATGKHLDAQLASRTQNA